LGLALFLCLKANNQLKGKIMSKKHVVSINNQSYTIPESDLWQKPGIDKDIITHDGVRKLMLKAGITIDKVDPIVMPINGNGSRIAFLASGVNAEGRRSFAVGEADPSNLAPNTVASRYPTIMAFKRAVDRLVLDLLGLFDLYSDVEFSEANGNSTPAATPAPTSSGGSSNKGIWEDEDPTPEPSNGDAMYHSNSNDPPTEKQLRYLYQLGKRSGLPKDQLQTMMNAASTKKIASDFINELKAA
jgi:hypothetical protein